MDVDYDVMVFVRGNYDRVLGPNVDYLWSNNEAAIVIISRLFYIGIRTSLIYTKLTSISEIQLINLKRV
jgi:hypothetical protein